MRVSPRVLEVVLPFPLLSAPLAPGRQGRGHSIRINKRASATASATAAAAAALLRCAACAALFRATCLRGAKEPSITSLFICLFTYLCGLFIYLWMHTALTFFVLFFFLLGSALPIDGSFVGRVTEKSHTHRCTNIHPASLFSLVLIFPKEE